MTVRLDVTEKVVIRCTGHVHAPNALFPHKISKKIHLGVGHPPPQTLLPSNLRRRSLDACGISTLSPAPYSEIVHPPLDHASGSCSAIGPCGVMTVSLSLW